MSSSLNLGELVARCKHKWLQVCKTRGTPQPDNAHVANFLASLPAKEQAELDHALSMCLNGREKNRELDLISWAAACTRPGYLAKVHEHGLHCTGVGLFGAGLTLMDSGWDMSARIAQLQQNTADIESLRAILALQPTPSVIEAEELTVDLRAGDDTAPAAAYPEPEPIQVLRPEPVASPFDLFDTRPGRNVEHVSRPTAAKQVQTEDALLSSSPEWHEADPTAVTADGRLQVRLFGRDAAHTLEIGEHRRGADFMGVHVVTIESARALAGGGYDWRRKLVIQLTPEEMPSAIAVLMNFAASAKFGQHGADRDKFIELRQQEGGLVVVTGQGSSLYAVPVKTGAIYYMLSLFCRAMTHGQESRSVSDVLALVRSING